MSIITSSTVLAGWMLTSLTHSAVPLVGGGGLYHWDWPIRCHIFPATV